MTRIVSKNRLERRDWDAGILVHECEARKGDDGSTIHALTAAAGDVAGGAPSSPLRSESNNSHPNIYQMKLFVYTGSEFAEGAVQKEIAGYEQTLEGFERRTVRHTDF